MVGISPEAAENERLNDEFIVLHTTLVCMALKGDERVLQELALWGSRNWHHDTSPTSGNEDGRSREQQTRECQKVVSM